MKKFLPLLLTLTLLTFPACSGGETDMTESESETEAETLIPTHEWDCDDIPLTLISEIKLAYRTFCGATSDEFLNCLCVSRYFGNFNGCDVVFIDEYPPIYNDMLRPLEVAGYIIVFHNGRPLYIYKDGAVYLLKDAYENGLLTKEDVYQIALKTAFEIYDASEFPPT